MVPPGKLLAAFVCFLAALLPPGVKGAQLDALVASHGALDPSFAPGTFLYTLNVARGTSLTLTPTYSGTTTGGAIDGAAVAQSTASSALALPAGTNTFNFVLTDADTTTVTYTFTVVISDPVISDLAIDSGTLVPAFESGTLSYTVSVTNGVADMTVTPTSDPAAGITLTVQASAVASGAASDAIALTEGGDTTITTVVSTAAGSATYTIVVTRAPSSVAGLADLVPSASNIDNGIYFGTYSYTMSVGNGISTLAFTPTLTHPSATVTIGGTLVAQGVQSPGQVLTEGGTTTVTIIVTAQDTVTSNTYTIDVTRAPSSDATLSDVTLSSGTLSPSFAPGLTTYTASVINAVPTFSVTPTVNHPLATQLRVEGVDVSSASPSPPHAIPEGGSTSVTVTTIAQDGTSTASYTITVSRGPSTISSLQNLVPEVNNLHPAFDSAIFTYYMSVGNSIATIKFTPTMSHLSTIQYGALATAQNAEVPLTAVADGVESGPSPLTEGGNSTVRIVVTAQDTVTTSEYQIHIVRAPSSNVGLYTITPSLSLLVPVFEEGIYEYDITVANERTAISFTMNPKHYGITMSIPPAANTLIEGFSVTFNLTFTAQDGVSTATYTMTVHRQPSSVADIDYFNYTVGTLMPTFDFNVYSYKMTVPNAVDSIQFAASVVHPYGQLTIGGYLAEDGLFSTPLTLTAGTVNQIDVVSTAQDLSTTKVYSVFITRSAPLNETCKFIRFGLVGVSDAPLENESPLGLYESQHHPNDYINGKQWYREVGGNHFMYFDMAQYGTLGGAWVISWSPFSKILLNDPEPTVLPTDAGTAQIIYYNMGDTEVPYEINHDVKVWQGNVQGSYWNNTDARYVANPDSTIARVFCTLDALGVQKI